MILALLLACTVEAPVLPPPPPPPPAPHDPDAAPLAALGIPGPGEGRRHRVEHHLHLPSEEGAGSATVAVTAIGLRVEAGEAGEAGEAWELRAWEDVALDAAVVALRRAELEALAADWGGTYEGWEAAPLAVERP